MVSAGYSLARRSEADLIPFGSMRYETASMKLAFRRTQRKEVIMNTYTAWGENPDDSIVQTAPGRKPTAKKGPDPLKVILTTEQGVQNLQQLLTGCGKTPYKIRHRF